MSGNTQLPGRTCSSAALTRLTFIRLPWIGVNTRVGISRAVNLEPVANWRQTSPVNMRWGLRRLLPSKVWRTAHHLGMLMHINMPMRAFMITDIAMNAEISDVSDMAVADRIDFTSIGVLDVLINVFCDVDVLATVAAFFAPDVLNDVDVIDVVNDINAIHRGAVDHEEAAV
ncbi:hypothetical protein [Methylomonas sp. 11b]|uniref:hypothetical protein n=1 Tax=Methylomonas sp. 11b TaxID=1168169 RepID=UPI0012DF50D8|nr:hypothetical protein [Methylomonas sp. 11b]